MQNAGFSGSSTGVWQVLQRGSLPKRVRIKSIQMFLTIFRLFPVLNCPYCIFCFKSFVKWKSLIRLISWCYLDIKFSSYYQLRCYARFSPKVVVTVETGRRSKGRGWNNLHVRFKHPFALLAGSFREGNDWFRNDLRILKLLKKTWIFKCSTNKIILIFEALKCSGEKNT